MKRMDKVLSELPDYFDKEEIKEWIEKWKEIGRNLTEEEIDEIMKASELR